MTETDKNPPAGEQQIDARDGDDARDGSHAVFCAKRGMWVDGTGDVSGFSKIVRLPPRIVSDENPQDNPIIARLTELVPELIDAPVVSGGDQLTVYVPRELLLRVARALRDDAQLRYETCSSVSGVHYPHDKDAELHAVYHLYSFTHNRRIRLEAVCPVDEPHIPSLTSIYPGVNFHERETWDMFGIIFDGHPCLTRILMPDDWSGHPQRKDYKLGGIPVEFSDTDIPSVENRRRYR
ncbi:NADH-quinone oxidoreductase subunit C [Corynebacterium pyruviciproducens]